MNSASISFSWLAVIGKSLPTGCYLRLSMLSWWAGIKNDGSDSSVCRVSVNLLFSSISNSCSTLYWEFQDHLSRDLLADKMASLLHFLHIFWCCSPLPSLLVTDDLSLINAREGDSANNLSKLKTVLSSPLTRAQVANTLTCEMWSRGFLT